MKQSRELTEDEVRDQFLDHVRYLVEYWSEVKDRTTKEKLDGLAFSILSAIDGCNSSLPSFILAPLPHEDDKEFRINNNEDYFPENHESEVKCDIGGYLHEKYYI